MPIDDEHEVLKVDGDIEAIEAVEKREPEGEPEALDLGGDGEALEPKGKSLFTLTCHYI